MLLRLPLDVQVLILRTVSVHDLASLLRTSRESAAIIDAYLDAAYGPAFDAFVRCTLHRRLKTRRNLMRYAAPMTLREWSYKCAVCGSAIMTLGACPSCYARMLKSRREMVRRTSLRAQRLCNIVVAALIFCNCLVLSASDSVLVQVIGVFACLLISSCIVAPLEISPAAVFII